MNVALAFENKISLARRALFVRRFRHQERWARLVRGLAYAFGRPFAEGDLHTLRIEMNERLGYYPIMTLATEDVLEEARSLYGDECVSAPVSDPAPPPRRRRPQSRRNTISTVANILKTQALQAENLT